MTYGEYDDLCEIVKRHVDNLNTVDAILKDICDYRENNSLFVQYDYLVSTFEISLGAPDPNMRIFICERWVKVVTPVKNDKNKINVFTYSPSSDGEVLITHRIENKTINQFMKTEKEEK